MTGPLEYRETGDPYYPAGVTHEDIDRFGEPLESYSSKDELADLECDLKYAVERLETAEQEVKELKEKIVDLKAKWRLA